MRYLVQKFMGRDTISLISEVMITDYTERVASVQFGGVISALDLGGRYVLNIMSGSLLEKDV